jgi:hypothetical protein
MARFLFLLLLMFATACLAGPYMNGFDLRGSLVPNEQIFAGGPPRDGIPAIDRPRFVSPEKAAISAHDRVLGMRLNGVTKAYPIAILNWHEIVNDRFDSDAVVVSYCPLCGSGMAFRAKVDGHNLTFGVSGLLYNSDLLLYDRHSESLWSQIERRAISGRFRGRRLALIPLEHTTWQDWRQRHPHSLVLSRETGFSRDYDRHPYAGYDQSREIYFPLAIRAYGYHPKERILGIELDGHFKAYPFSELSKHAASVEDSLGGRRITVHFDAENQTARAEHENGAPLPGVVAYWFAWYAFHPESDVFKSDNDRP